MIAGAIAREAEATVADPDLPLVRAWKERHPGRPAVGHLPVYAPRELIAACGGLPVSVAGNGDIEVVEGDACFQSYLCHLPRSTVELAKRGHLDPLDAMIFPATCDVIRNLSGVWKLLFPERPARYLELPQRYDPAGRAFYRRTLERLAEAMVSWGGTSLRPNALREAIARYGENRSLIESLYELRARSPKLVPADELHHVVRAGGAMPVEEHTELLGRYLEAASKRERRAEDRIRVILAGAFCEGPPAGLLRTIERAGCYVVEDDLEQGFRIAPSASPDPLEALVDAWCAASAAIRWDEGRSAGAALVAKVRSRKADGVVFLAPSFCEPALLDRPRLAKALDEARIPHIAFQYAENTGQFQLYREQAGTFSDSIRLWGER